ncbi:hypothetical protein [Brevibacillus aydinogluensis]|uniref:Transcriptional regulator n=1 Tax=Brevibacillus aydinogluensis TaxID=927786 RepID=A0AA48M8C3_9BACL|nr:hypothetical protein [Brevibacillus aydinogluensis]CAJ1000877.1 Transcriptional regulator [Brevibacillus aydinogluensis]
MGFALATGGMAGLVLAAFLALGDGLFQTSTLSVLIDVSYAPGLEGLPSVVELLVHLLVSAIVAFFMMYFYPRTSGERRIKYLSYWVLAFAAAYLPFSLLSGAAVSWADFFLWLLGHLLYTLIIAVQAERQR